MGKKKFIKLHYLNHENSFKVFIKFWWKSILGILVNLIFNLLPMENMTCIKLLSIHYYLVIIANHFTIWVHYVCYVFTTFGSCVSINFFIRQPLMLISRNSCTTCKMLKYLKNESSSLAIPPQGNLSIQLCSFVVQFN